MACCNSVPPIVHPMRHFPLHLFQSPFQVAITNGNQSAVFASSCSPCLIDILDLNSLSFQSQSISIDFGYSPSRLEIFQTEDPNKMIVCTLTPFCSFVILCLKSRSFQIFKVDETKSSFAAVFSIDTNSLHFFLQTGPVIEIVVKLKPFEITSFVTIGPIVSEFHYCCHFNNSTIFFLTDESPRLAAFDTVSHTFWMPNNQFDFKDRAIFFKGPSLVLECVQNIPEIEFPEGKSLTVYSEAIPTFAKFVFTDDFGLFFICEKSDELGYIFLTKTHHSCRKRIQLSSGFLTVS
jgi:hypothetical protein